MSTTAYEPPTEALKDTEPTLSAYGRAVGAVRDALGLTTAFQAHEDVTRTLRVLLAIFEAEPEADLLASDYRYLAAKLDRASDTVRANFHPTNAATLGHLAQARESLKVGLANMLVRV